MQQGIRGSVLYPQAFQESSSINVFSWSFQPSQEVCSWSCAALEEQGEKVSETFLPSGPLLQEISPDCKGFPFSLTYRHSQLLPVLLEGQEQP